MASRQTIAHLGRDLSQARRDRTAFFSLRGDRWEKTTWRQAEDIVSDVAAGLHDLGCRHGDRVAILCRTRWEWALVDFGVLAMGGVVVGVYPNDTQEQIRYVLDHSGSRVVFVEDEEQLAKVRPLRARLPQLEEVVVIDPIGTDRAEAGAGRSASSFDGLRRSGRALRDRDRGLVDRVLDTVRPDDVATLVYTSGTTGPPKGVVLTHRNLFEIAERTNEAIPLSDDDVGVVFLPLAHSLQRVSLYAGWCGGVVGVFAPSLERLHETWQTAQPTVMSSVPRVFEKVHQQVTAAATQQPPLRRKIFQTALAVGVARSRLIAKKAPVPLQLELAARLFDRLVFAKIRERTFGRRIRYLFSGGAPINPELLELFHAFGILILEAYGLTETSAQATINRPDDFRFGTVGRPLPGVEIRIADDGEVLIRSPGNFREYFKDPEATAAAIDGDGWFHSGDVGALDADGFLRITDRKKNLIITSGGKNIAPQNIEGLITADPWISQALVHGDRRRYLVALVTLDAERICAERGEPNAGDVGALSGDPTVVSHVEAAIERVNAQLARYETIKRFRILPEDFTVENDLLTPTLKVRRRAVEARYSALIDEMYRD